MIPGLEEPGMQYDLDFRLGHSPLSYYTINVRTTNTGEPEFEGIANSYNVVSINAFNFGGLSLKCDHRLLAMEGYQEYWAPDGYGGVYRAKRYNTFKYDETRIGVELQMQLFLSNYIGLYYSHKNIQGYELGEHIWEETEYNVSKPKDMMGMYLGFGFVIPITKFLQNYQNLDFSVDYDGFLMSYATGIAIPFGEHFNLKFDYRWFMKSLEDEYIDEFRYANLDGGKSYGITAAFWM